MPYQSVIFFTGRIHGSLLVITSDLCYVTGQMQGDHVCVELHNMGDVMFNHQTSQN